ncbi:MAG: DUF5985 family protein [Gemmatimonadota bacterium]|nr:DUF5985 family protein [Gemmatimonadota bacterium]
MVDAMAGAIITGYAVVALLFLRFWRGTRDRLFLIFAGAFALLGVQRALLLAVPSPATGEEQTGFYLLRLMAFLLILYGIVDKNRGGEAA